MRGDGPARLTAATVVSATGALLLLAAAATFLAVTWDTLGLAARVAVVAAGTAGAIVGGARLRRTLPAVGAVVFHLGALLLPVDALGLALQLGAGRAATWTAVGATAVLTLPVAAHVGRSRVLAGVALAGVPVLATGLGLGGLAPAPLLTAAAALSALLVVRLDRDVEAGLRTVLGLAAPVLALVAVAGPLLVATGSAAAVAGGGTPLVAVASAGWLPTTWAQPVLAGTLAVLALAGAAVLRRSSRLAGAVPVLAALVAVTLLLPGDAPRVARLLPWPLLFLAVEAAAAALRRDRALGGAVGRVASVVEVAAAFAVPGALVTVATATRSAADLLGFGGAASQVAADPVLGAVAGLTALAWTVAVLRRPVLDGSGAEAGVETPGGRAGRGPGVGVVGAATAAVASGAATATLLVPTTGVGPALLLVAIVAAAFRRGGGAPGAAVSSGAVLLAGPLIAGTWSVATFPGWAPATVAPALIAVVAALVAGVLTLRVARHAEAGEGVVAGTLLLPVVVGLLWLVGAALDEGFGFQAWIVAVPALLLAGAAVLDRVPVGADLLRALAAAIVLLAGPTGSLGLDAAVAVAPAALLVAAVLGAESVRCRRPWVLVGAGLVLVRGVAGAAHAVTGAEVATGAVLLGLAVTAALLAVARPAARLAGAVTAVTAAVPAIVLLSLTPTALAWGTVAVGATVVAGGLATRQVPVAHVGGVVVTFGVWQLLGLAEVTAVDVWLIAPALQLWLVGWPARRGGRVSSWVADVPPLALVLVPALLERLSGGSGWHAALAGALALVAVIGGGVGRHGGPLVVGVVGVVAVVAIETLAVVAAVPTWVWLTAGGVVLLGAGALIERTGGAPVATVRRLVDVVAERFD